MKKDDSCGLTDKILLKRSIEGDRTAFESIIRKYDSKLFCFIRNRTKTDEEAEDILQSTFLKLFRNMKKFNPEYKFSTWLYTIATRVIIDSSRSNKRRKLLESKISEIQKQEKREELVETPDLWKIAGALNHEQYRILWLKYREEMSVAEISLETGKSAVNVRVLLYRARNNLRKLLAGEKYSSFINYKKRVKLFGRKSK